MPKKASLPIEISKARVHKGTKWENTKWLLWSRASWKGPRIQRYFETKAEAEEEQEKLIKEHNEHGQLAHKLDSGQRLDAFAAIGLLAGRATLQQAAQYWLRINQPKGGSKSVREAIADHLRELRRRGNTEEYVKAQEIALNVFARGHNAPKLDDKGIPIVDAEIDQRPFGERNIAEFTGDEINGWLHAPVHGRKGDQNWEALNLGNYVRDIGMLFHTANEMGWIDGKPMNRVTRPKVNRTPPDIYTIEEITKVLHLAKQKNLLEMYALCLFSGIRIEEIAKVRWEWIVWGEGEIRLPGFYVCEDQKTVRITKNGQPRNLPISKALKAWIPKRGEGGLVVYPKNLRKRREAVAEAAGVAGKRNALRHSFASYHAAKHRDPGLLQMILGHETSSVMFRHYITAVKGADAKRFFALRPEKLIAEAC